MKNFILIFVLSLSAPFPAYAESPTVPADVQAKLLVKVAGFDRNFAVRAGDTAKILLLKKPGSAEGERFAGQAVEAFKQVGTLAGLPLDVQVMSAKPGPQVTKRCQDEKISIIFLAPGFSQADIQAFVSSMSDQNLLTVTSVPSLVDEGVVVGFDLVMGKPKILVNLGQARKQKVALTAGLLSLADVRNP